jgi:hypothetical protein
LTDRTISRFSRDSVCSEPLSIFSLCNLATHYNLVLSVLWIIWILFLSSDLPPPHQPTAVKLSEKSLGRGGVILALCSQYNPAITVQ